MYPSVRAAFWDFTTALEGYVDGMYCDVLGLVTTGVGNLIDPFPAALSLPWRLHDTGCLATEPEIYNEWKTVKAGRIPAWKGPRPLYLPAADIKDLVGTRLDANEGILAKRWANWDEWPADAQLGAHSCAWAAGAGWRAPRFDAAVAALDFQTAGKESWLRDEGNPGLHIRNLRNATLFQNAERARSKGLDPWILYWPTEVPAT